MLTESPRGPQVFGTLVAPAGDVWRARILTYPNILWVASRGVTIKFVGETAAKAENKAIEFIKQHCERNGLKMGKVVPTVDSGALNTEQDAAMAKSREVQASQRQVHAMRIRYGIERPDRDAETDDISEIGLFVRTTDQFDEGTSIRLYLEIEGFGIPLRGVVRWTRKEEEGDGRPAGMGVKLIAPHPRYVHYCRQRQASNDAEEASTTEIDLDGVSGEKQA